MARTVKIDDEQVAAAAEVNKGFQPIPGGKYNFTIFDADSKFYKEPSKKVGEEYYELVLRVDGGKQDGRKLTRVQVPLFQNWAVSDDPKKAAKNPKGFPTNFAPFFTALGYEVTGKFSIPEPGELLGKRLSATLTVDDDDFSYKRALKDDPTAEQKDYKRNGIGKFNPPIEGLGEASVEADEVSGGFNL